MNTVTRGELRVSDADRDRAIAELTGHFEAGRITQAEFDERSSQALTAKTEGDLAALFADLPGRGAAVPPPPPPSPVAAGADPVPAPRPGPAGPFGPFGAMDLPRRLPVARIAIAVVVFAALGGGLSIGGHHSVMFLIVPILIVLAVIRRLARYR